MSILLHIVGIPKNVKKEEVDRILNEAEIPFLSNKIINLDDEIELDPSTITNRED